jgi:arylsulfatase A-like enzyme
MQGESLLPVFSGENVKRQKPIFWEWRRGKAVYADSYKIVKEGLDQPWELYNIENDPTETENLSETNAEKVKEMEQLFNDWKSTLPDYSK